MAYSLGESLETGKEQRQCQQLWIWNTLCLYCLPEHSLEGILSRTQYSKVTSRLSPQHPVQRGPDQAVQKPDWGQPCWIAAIKETSDDVEKSLD